MHISKEEHFKHIQKLMGLDKMSFFKQASINLNFEIMKFKFKGEELSF